MNTSYVRRVLRASKLQLSRTAGVVLQSWMATGRGKRCLKPLRKSFLFRPKGLRQGRFEWYRQFRDWHELWGCCIGVCRPLPEEGSSFPVLLGIVWGAWSWCDCQEPVVLAFVVTAIMQVSGFSGCAHFPCQLALSSCDLGGFIHVVMHMFCASRLSNNSRNSSKRWLR